MPFWWSRERPYWWRRRRNEVLVPLGIGLMLCGLGLWTGLVYQHNQDAFYARAVPAKAVIDRLSTTPPSQGYGAPTFDEYALVHFTARGKRQEAEILVDSGCTVTCAPGIHVGQVLNIIYSSENPRSAELASRGHGPSADILYAFLLFAVLGLLFLVAAVVNVVAP